MSTVGDLKAALAAFPDDLDVVAEWEGTLNLIWAVRRTHRPEGPGWWKPAEPCLLLYIDRDPPNAAKDLPGVPVLPERPRRKET